MRFALVSNILPPGDSSHAAVIHRLLRDLDTRHYCLVSSGGAVSSARLSDSGGLARLSDSGGLAGTRYDLPPVPRLTRGHRLGLRLWRERLNFGVGVILRARAIARILRLEKCDAVVVCTGGHEILDFPAAFLASRLTGTRFYAYLLDQYGHMVAHVLGKHIFARLEPMLLKRAAAVIAPNEVLRDEVRRQYQVEALVIHNPCDLEEYDGPAASETPQDGEVKIVYTGSVGPLQFEPFRNLLAAIARLDRRNIRLHLYTAQSPDRLEREGIRGPVEIHPPQSLAAMPAIQQRADVLFLPLALHSDYPDIVRTAAPGKIGEYLAACRPILVHAPTDSFLASYFRDHQCGLVVDRSDPAALAAALESILGDPAVRARLRAHAWQRAEADFNLTDARRQFAQAIGLPPASA